MMDGMGQCDGEDGAEDTPSNSEGIAAALVSKSVWFVVREKGFIIASQLLERFTYVGIYALLPMYLMRYPMLLTSDETILVIHGFFFTTFFLAFVIEMLVAAGMTTAFPTVTLSALAVAGSVGVLSVSLVAALLAAQRIFVVQLSHLFHGSAYASLLLVAAGSGGLRSTLPILGSWHYGISRKNGLACMESAEVTRAIDKHRGHFLLLLWYAEYVAYALAVIIVPLVASKISCLNMPNCYPAAYGLTTVTALSCLGMIVCALYMLKPIDEPVNAPSRQTRDSNMAIHGRCSSGSLSELAKKCAGDARLPMGKTPTLQTGIVESGVADESTGKLHTTNITVSSLNYSTSATDSKGSPSTVAISVTETSPWRMLAATFRQVHAATHGFLMYLRARHGNRADALEVSPAFRRSCESGIRALQTFTPVVLFWALYSQQNSMWVFQATRMQCILRFPFFVRSRVLWLDPLVIRIRPEQTIVARPLCAMAMYPVVMHGLIPLMRAVRRGEPVPPTGLMLGGLVLAAVAFGVSACLQALIVGAVTTPPRISGSSPWGVGTVPVILQLPQYLLMATGELLLAPAAMAFVLHGDSVDPIVVNAGSSRTVMAVSYMHFLASMSMAQVLVGVIVAVGASVSTVSQPTKILWTLVVWTAIGFVSSMAFGTVLAFYRKRI